MFCDHKKTKMKLTAWAYWDWKNGHRQGFAVKPCCVRCGKEVLDVSKAIKEAEDFLEKHGPKPPTYEQMNTPLVYG